MVSDFVFFARPKRFSTAAILTWLLFLENTVLHEKL